MADIERYISLSPVDVLRCVGDRPLSGFLGGNERGGREVVALEDEWAKKFGVAHAIAINSCTSGLYALAVVLNLKTVYTTPFTMSATAAAPKVAGAEIHFCEIEDETYGLDPEKMPKLEPGSAVYVTNLFGHPARLQELRRLCNAQDCYLIEDNAQSIFALEHGRYAGTIGHAGVFSLNVHKHLQCGEGGIIVTDDDYLAKKLRGFLNHGELMGLRCGLNLRMTEIQAAIARSQLARSDEIMEGRVKQAEAVIEAFRGHPNVNLPVTREGCTHSYYVVPFCMKPKHRFDRHFLVSRLNNAGLPIVQGYVPPINMYPSFRGCPTPTLNKAREYHSFYLFYFSNCEWTLSPAYMARLRDLVQGVTL